MTGSVALDVVIGLVFIYALYSLLVSIVQEILATTLAFRAKILEKAIFRMLEDDKGKNALNDRIGTWLRLISPMKSDRLISNGLATEFYKHSLIKYLAEDNRYSKPSYISSSNFSKVILDILKGDTHEAGDDIRPFIEASLKKTEDKKDDLAIPTETKRFLWSLWLDAQGDIDKFRQLLENWFDDTMKRATGWYKKYNQTVLFFISFFIAIVFNVDSLLVVKKLSTDPEIRSQVISQVNNFQQAHPNLDAEFDRWKADVEHSTKDSTEKAEKIRSITETHESLTQKRDSLINKANSLINEDIKQASDLLGLGWRKHKQNCSCWCNYTPNGNSSWGGRIIGWLLTALALSLGAPFWFDLLNKLMKLRGSLKTEVKPETKISNDTTINIKETHRVG